eukprot:4899157-Amphidinium_carterae.1
MLLQYSRELLPSMTGPILRTFRSSFLLFPGQGISSLLATQQAMQVLTVALHHLSYVYVYAPSIKIFNAAVLTVHVYRDDSTEKVLLFLLGYVHLMLLWSPKQSGFDPYGFSNDVDTFNYMRLAELKHARWAMLAALGTNLSVHGDVSKTTQN